MRIPNRLHESIPIGKYDNDNKVIKDVCKQTKPTFKLDNH